MKRDLRLCTLALAAGLLAFGAPSVFSQERPSPSPSGGSGEHPSPPSSGSGASSSAPAAPSGGSSSSSSGGSSMGSGGGGGDHAISRGEGRRGGGGSLGTAVPRTGSPRSVILPSGPTASDPGDRRVPSPGERRGSGSPIDNARSRGDRPATGTAVDRPRDISNVPPIAWGQNPYWSTAYWYPCYGWGGGYCYYDPFWWDYYYGYAPGYYGGYDNYAAQGDYDTGGLKLKVKPRSAQVYVDGYFSGLVDDYDGVFQRLKLRPGAHRVELRAEGYQPAVFDVLIVEGETVTYRAELKPR